MDFEKVFQINLVLKEFLFYPQLIFLYHHSTRVKGEPFEGCVADTDTVDSTCFELVKAHIGHIDHVDAVIVAVQSSGDAKGPVAQPFGRLRNGVLGSDGLWPKTDNAKDCEAEEVGFLHRLMGLLPILIIGTEIPEGSFKLRVLAIGESLSVVGDNDVRSDTYGFKGLVIGGDHVEGTGVDVVAEDALVGGFAFSFRINAEIHILVAKATGIGDVVIISGGGEDSACGTEGLLTNQLSVGERFDHLAG